ncbi:MAG: hypothetical protein ACEPOZ_22090, partial [Marinifilaceae bacterium]
PVQSFSFDPNHSRLPLKASAKIREIESIFQIQSSFFLTFHFNSLQIKIVFSTISLLNDFNFPTSTDYPP